MSSSVVRPVLREATRGLRMITMIDPVTGMSSLGVAGQDDQASVVAELGGLLDALGDAVGVLASTSGSPTDPGLDDLGDTLREAGAHATTLCLPPDPALGAGWRSRWAG